MNTVVPIAYKVRDDDRLKVALDAMPVAVAWSRLDDGRVEFMNDCFVKMFGYRSKDVSDVFELIALTFADSGQAQVAVAALRNIIGQNVFDRINLPAEEIPCVRKDGSRLVTSFSGVVLPEANMSLATFVDISATKLHEQLLHRLSEEDPLTGLMNRRSFDAALAATIGDRSAKSGFGILVLDLDGFKGVNDTYGHKAGDDLLRTIAKRMKVGIRQNDLLARWGGDEFAVLLGPPVGDANVRAVIDRLKRAVEEPITLNGAMIRVGVSAGWAAFPKDADNLVDLYQIADRAMYAAKRRSRRRRADTSDPGAASLPT